MMKEKHKDPGRTKKWATKTRTGCITCRRRRIKCDEGSPSCRKCLATGRDCEGYSTAPATVVASVCLQPSQTYAPAGIEPTGAEHAAFDMLQSEFIGRVAGLFNRSFWQVDLMRATQVYPAIWNAGLAVAAMYRATSITAKTGAARESRQRNHAFALREYNTAISALLRTAAKPDLSNGDKESLLLASTLFTCLSCLQEDYAQALHHARGGNRLFCQWEFWRCSDTRPPDGMNDDSTDLYKPGTEGSRRADCVLTTKSLAAVFTHFETQFCNRLRTVDVPEWRWRGRPHRCSNIPFASAADAYTELQPLLAGFLHNGRYFGVPQDIVEARLIQRSQASFNMELSAWKGKLDAFVDSPRGRAAMAVDSRSIATLRFIFMGLEIARSRDKEGFGGDEMNWDSLNARAAELTAFAERHFVEEHCEDAPRDFGFSFSMSVCEILTHAGTCCRDGRIRRRIIALLDSWRRRDGLLDARMLARVVRAVMELEENATVGVADADREPGCDCVTGEFICREHRVCLIDTKFLGERRAVILLTTVSMFKKGLKPLRTGVSW